MYNFNHLYYFYVTASAGGITVAAKRLRISQPSLSSQIKVLERQIGLKLFAKVGRRLELTSNGRLVYGYCRKMFQPAEEMADRFSNSNQVKGERIRVGVSVEVARPFVVDLLSRIVAGKIGEAQPMIVMNSGQYADLIEQVRNLTLDVAVLTKPALTDDIAVLGVSRMPVVLAYSPKLQTKASLPRKAGDVRSIMETIDGGWVLPSPALRLRQETDLLIEKKKLVRATVFESDMLVTMIRAIVDGVGVGFIPLNYVWSAVQAGQVKVVGPDEGFWQHSLWLVGRESDRRDPLAQDLALAFRDVAQEYSVR